MSTTLQELKNQIDAANELGVTNITKKGGTISSDATTAEIMAEIDNLPSGGGGAAPTVVDEIQWNGEPTSESFVFGEDTFYKVSDSVLPMACQMESASFHYNYTYKADSSRGDVSTVLEMMIISNAGMLGALFDTGLFVCAMYDGAEIVVEEDVSITIPKSGTWMASQKGQHLSKVTAVEEPITNIPPEVTNEITWDGDTTGLESHEVDFGGGVTRTYYKVSDSVLPYAVFNETDYYAYAGVNQDNETSAMTCNVFDGYVGLNNEYDVISAYLNNSESSIFGGVLVPAIGTWFLKDGNNYIKSVTVTEDAGE